MVDLSEEQLEDIFGKATEGLSVPEELFEWARGIAVQVVQDADADSCEENLMSDIGEVLTDGGMPEDRVKELITRIKRGVFGGDDQRVSKGGTAKATPKAATKAGASAKSNRTIAMVPAEAQSTATPKGDKLSSKTATLGSKGAADSKKAPGQSNRERGDYVCQIPDLMLMYGGGKLLLKNANLSLRRGHRYGIVGQNGAGKTTLLSMILKGKIQQLPRDRYSIVAVNPAVLEERGSLETCRVVEFVDALEEKMKEDGNSPNLTAHQVLDIVGFSSVADDSTVVAAGPTPDVARNTVDDLQGTVNEPAFSSRVCSWNKHISELSGGWRMRLALATALLENANPDLLLLDEPTNHLDKYAVSWLADYLQGKDTTASQIENIASKTATIIVSHDPEFLDRVCTDIIYFENKTLTYFEGNLTNVKKKLKLSAEAAEKMLDVRYENVDDAAGPAGEAPVGCIPAGGPDKLSFPIPGKLDGIANDKKSVIELKNITFRYGSTSEETNPTILENISCRLTLNSRIALVGANGAGKSTLMGLLSGELTPDSVDMVDSAKMFKHRNLRLAYLAQHHTFHLQEYWNCSILVYMQKRFKDGWDEELQKRLKHVEGEELAFVEEQARRMGKYGKRVKDLCGRQKRGKELWYEVQWADLDDAKQNTFEPLSKLREMGVEKVARAYDERQQAMTVGNDQRPLSTREIVKHFENFGFDEDMICYRELGSFSMGQKSRLTLGAAMWVKPHCLMLDEPTNYIDQETLDALSKALKFFRGAVVMISHKQSFVEQVCTEQWLISNKSIDASKIVKE